MSQTLKKRVFEILEYSDPNDWLSRMDDISVTFLVLVDCTAFILQSSPQIFLKYHFFLSIIELIAVVYFTILYGLQLWSCTADPRYARSVWGRVRYALTPLAIVDLMAILPFYLLKLFPHVALIESTAIFRLLRLLKLIRYSEALQTIIRVIKSKREELLMTFFAVIILLIFASTVMFFAENKAQPEEFPSIPVAMWWGVVTLTTVGYGDIYPITPLGKIFGAALAFIGIGLFALPAGIVASGFSEEIHKRKRHEIDELSAEQKRAIASHVDQSAELMKLCVEAAQKKLGDCFHNEEIIRDLATTLYKETARKFKL